LGFGTYYVQVHEENDNGLFERTTEAITLRPTGNTNSHFKYRQATEQIQIDKVANVRGCDNESAQHG